MTIEAWGKTYELEYTFEAAHYKACVQKAWAYFSGASMMSNAAMSDLDDGETAGRLMTLGSVLNSMADVPDMVITFLYAGLLEHHSDEITSERDARDLYKQFGKEHPDDERAMEFGMLEAIREQMEKDGFFKRIGLSQIQEEQAKAMKTTKTPKAPQDHKKAQK